MKSFVLLVLSMLFASTAEAGISANAKYELNNRMGAVAFKHGLGTLLDTAHSQLTGANDDIFINSTDDTWKVLSDDNDLIFQIAGFEAKTGKLELCSDECDDAADKFSWTVDAADLLTFKNGTTSLWSVTSAGAVTGVGTQTIAGFVQKQVAATATTITIAQCGSSFVNTGAVQMELPEASTALGCRLTFITGNASNFDVNPDNSDLITVQTNSAGDAMRNATLGNSITIEAVSAVNWAVISVVGTWSDIN